MAQSNIERDIGTLLAKVESIERNMQRADDHRAVVHRRMDDLVEDVGEMRTDMTAVKRDLADTKEVTDAVKIWRQRGMGALAVTGVASSALTALIASYWSEILRALRNVTP